MAVFPGYTAGADRPYWEGLLANELRLPRCAGCGQWQWPAVYRCQHCGNWEQHWQAVALTGQIFSWTRTWHPFPGLESLPVPFVTVLVALPTAGNIRLLGILEDSDADPAINANVTGRIMSTAFQEMDIPALRWRLT